VLHPKNANFSNKNSISGVNPPVQSFLIQRPEIPVKNVFSYIERKKTINNEFNNPIQSTAEILQMQSIDNAQANPAGQPLKIVSHENTTILISPKMNAVRTA
jgi:hypothetical protein